MAKAFSVISWNVKHFGATSPGANRPTKPIEPILEYLNSHNGDVIAIYEVVGRVIFDTIVTMMPGYQWHITEGPQSQEILIGVKKRFTTFYTQKITFKSGSPALRPGALLTLVIDGVNYPLLFLHLKSLTQPKGFGLRDDMIERAIDFRKVLNKKELENSGNNLSNFIFVGDLNTMGMNLTYSNKDISAEEEIARLEKRLKIKRVKMNILKKTHPATYWGGSRGTYPPGNLDHVVASNHMEFKKFNGFPVDVRGWVEKNTDSKKDAWVKKYSDHALMYFEVQKL